MKNQAKENLSNGLENFSAPIANWFKNAFPSPTEIQTKAWSAIAKGTNALVIAPTGSGKTLAAFLFAIDKLMTEKIKESKKREESKRTKNKAPKKNQSKGARILYVSPLKALAADVEHNLTYPLLDITTALKQTETYAPEISIGMRTGDTPSAKRAKLIRNPPDILITTPESLYLMLTSQARKILATVETVIVDEVHSLAGNKRGAHLSLSLERLDSLLKTPAQRIGLSATVRPRQVAADFLGGIHPVEIIATDTPPSLDLSICVPVSDMTAIPSYGAQFGRPNPIASKRSPSQKDAWKTDRDLKAAMIYGNGNVSTPDTRMGSVSIWPHIEASILDEVLNHRSTIVFVNSRGLCERLTAHLNELYAKRTNQDADKIATTIETASIRSSIGPSTDLVSSVQNPIAKAHHGSVSKERRHAIEQELKAGLLPCVVATSSLELGIDMGKVDLVLQVAPPLSVSSGLQRMGRANHQVGGRSVGVIYPKVRTEIIDSVVIAEAMQAGDIEKTKLVENALDVLAQQTVAAVAVAPDGLPVHDWYKTVRKSACYSNLSKQAFDAVIRMLSGCFESGDVTDFAPRFLYDTEADLLKPLPRTQKLAVTSPGTIPDRGLYPVMLNDGSPKGGRRRVGELDEEMVHESRVGDVIVLGTSSWRITEITKDRVIVEAASRRSARLPFWHGEGLGRSVEEGKRRSAFLRALEKTLKEAASAASASTNADILNPLVKRLSQAGLNENAQKNLINLAKTQLAATDKLPTEHTIVIEQYSESTEEQQIIIHSPYGRRVHEPWALVIAQRIQATYDFDPKAAAADDGILLQIPSVEKNISLEEFLLFDPDEAAQSIAASISSTSLFAARFRECAARALLMSPTTPGKRTPLWQQRLHGAQLLEKAKEARNFPILAEATRECLNDVFDLAGFKQLMEDLQTGTVKLHFAHTDTPSPFAAPILFGYLADHIYQGDLPSAERNQALLSIDSNLLGELIGTPDILSLLDPEVIQAVEEELQYLTPSRKLVGKEGITELLRKLGPLTFEEIADRINLKIEDKNTEDTKTAKRTKDNNSNVSERLLAKELKDLQTSHRVFQTQIGNRKVWALAQDGSRLKQVLQVEVPSWALASPSAEKQTDNFTNTVLWQSLVLRFARTHSLFSADDLAENLNLGISLAEELLQSLAKEGSIKRLQRPNQTSLWTDTEVLKRLRLRSLAKARAAVEPIDTSSYMRYLLEIQGITVNEGNPAKGLDALAEVIALFEGVYFPASLWEEVIFPTRVGNYKSSMLDELLDSGEITWLGRKENESSTPLVAFFPTDSPAAPEPVSYSFDSFEQTIPEPDFVTNTTNEVSENPLLQAVTKTLILEGPLSFSQLMDALSHTFLENETPPPSDVAQVLLHLLWSGNAIVDSFTLVRHKSFELSQLKLAKASAEAPSQNRRVSSRRRHSLHSSALRQAKRSARESVLARNAAFDALSGLWSVVIHPEENQTIHAIEITESLFDRYGIITRNIALEDKVEGGLSALYPILRQLEDSGEALRGIFVEGLGPSQFIDRHTIETLRSFASKKSGSFVVLAGNDPAQLYGSILPWPQSSNSNMLSRREGSLVVLFNGTPIIFASKKLKNLVTFASDSKILKQAFEALKDHLTAHLKAKGAAGLKERILVETINDTPVLASDISPLLQEIGFVPDGRGLRLYLDPFYNL